MDSLVEVLQRLSEFGEQQQQNQQQHGGDDSELVGILSEQDLEVARTCSVWLQAQSQADCEQAWQQAADAGVSFVAVAAALNALLSCRDPTTAARAGHLYSALLRMKAGPVRAAWHCAAVLTMRCRRASAIVVAIRAPLQVTSLFTPLAFSNFLQVCKQCACGSGGGGSAKPAGAAAGASQSQRQGTQQGKRKAAGGGGKGGGRAKKGAAAANKGGDSDEEPDLEDDGSDGAGSEEEGEEAGGTQRGGKRGGASKRAPAKAGGAAGGGGDAALLLDVEAFLEGFGMQQHADMACMLMDTCVEVTCMAAAPANAAAMGAGAGGASQRAGGGRAGGSNAWAGARAPHHPLSTAAPYAVVPLPQVTSQSTPALPCALAVALACRQHAPRGRGLPPVGGAAGAAARQPRHHHGPAHDAPAALAAGHGRHGGGGGGGRQQARGRAGGRAAAAGGPGLRPARLQVRLRQGCRRSLSV